MNYDFFARYADTELINLFKKRYIFDPASPSGLANKIDVCPNSKKGKPVGSYCYTTSSYSVKILGKKYPVSHLVLLLNNKFPAYGQVARHKNGRFDNSIENLYWGNPIGSPIG